MLAATSGRAQPDCEGIISPPCDDLRHLIDPSMMAACNNLVLYDQHAAQNSLDTVISDLRGPPRALRDKFDR